MNRFKPTVCALVLLCIAADKSAESPGNLLLDPEFATIGKPGAAWKLTLVKKAPAELATETIDGKPAAVITIPTAAEQPWHVQLTQSKLELKKDQKYKLELVAKADGDHPINIFVQQNEKPYAMLGLNVPEKLTAESKTITHEFVCNADDSNAKVSVVVGAVAGKVTITSLSLTPANP